MSDRDFQVQDRAIALAKKLGVVLTHSPKGVCALPPLGTLFLADCSSYHFAPAPFLGAWTAVLEVLRKGIASASIAPRLDDILLANHLFACGKPGGVRAELRGTILRGVYLSGVDFRWADLCGSDLSHSDLRGAWFSRSHVRGAKLDGADLSWARLTWASFTGSSLLGTNLSFVDASKANLYGCATAGAVTIGLRTSGAGLPSPVFGRQYRFYLRSNRV